MIINKSIPQPYPPIYPYPPEEGLVMFFDFEEQGNKLIDHSGYGNHGINSGSVFSPVNIGGSRHFDAADDLITIPAHKSINDMPQFTFSCWFFYGGVGGRNNGLIFYKNSIRFVISALNNFFNFICIFSGDDGTWNTPSSGLSMGNWYHVQVSYDRSSADNNPLICINGDSKTIAKTIAPTGTANIDVAENLILGNREATDSYLNGKIGIPHMWNYLRSEADAKNDFNNTAWRFL